MTLAGIPDPWWGLAFGILWLAAYAAISLRFPIHTEMNRLGTFRYYPRDASTAGNTPRSPILGSCVTVAQLLSESRKLATLLSQ